MNPFRKDRAGVGLARMASNTAAWAACVILGIVLCLQPAPAHGQTAAVNFNAIVSEANANAQAAKITASRLTSNQRETAKQLFATGFSLAQQQDYNAAKIAFERGLAVDPSNAQAHYYLAEVLVQLNDPVSALRHYAMAYVLGGNSTEGIKAQAAMGPLLENIENIKRQQQAAAQLQQGQQRAAAQQQQHNEQCEARIEGFRGCNGEWQARCPRGTWGSVGCQACPLDSLLTTFVACSCLRAYCQGPSCADFDSGYDNACASAY